MLPARPDGIRLPKADDPEVVERLDTLLTEYEEKLDLEIGYFSILPSIESAVGVLNCVKTAQASRRIVALAFGAEDYTASLEIQRTRSGEELLDARTQIVWAAKAAGLQAIDIVFADVNDMDGLRARHRTRQAPRLHRQVARQPAADRRWCTRSSAPSRTRSTTRSRSWRRSRKRARWAPASSRCAARWWTPRW